MRSPAPFSPFKITKLLPAPWLCAAFCCLAGIFFHVKSAAQTGFQVPAADTSDKVTVQILHADLLEPLTTDTGSIQRLLGDVQMIQGTTQMFCDSAHIDLAKNNLEAFGAVRIIQPGGTQVEGDYVRYTGNAKLAYLYGNVALTDGKATLFTEELTYNSGTKIGTYSLGGTLQNGPTNLSSNSGQYNLNTKDARFTGEVSVTDPQYNVISDDLGYNTGTELVTFYAHSIVNNSDGSLLNTNQGVYDKVGGVADFTKRTSLQKAEQYIEGNKLHYNMKRSTGTAVGEVIVLDTAQHTTLWCGKAWYWGRSRRMLATEHPLLRKENGKDSLYTAADTFYSAPDPRFVSRLLPVGPRDTLGKPDSSGRRGTAARQPDRRSGHTANVTGGKPVAGEEARLEPMADSTAPRFVAGYHNVRIWSDSLQGHCDSLVYSRYDTTLRLMVEPVVWSRRSQISGDTILLYTDSNRVRQLYIPDKAFLTSRSGPDRAQLYDQIQGKTLTANFENGELHDMLVWPAAESIYFAKDNAGAYIGVNESQGERMRVFFEEGTIRFIKFEQQVGHKLTPMRQANLPSLRLSRFRWREDERPKSLQDLMAPVVPPPAPPKGK